MKKLISTTALAAIVATALVSSVHAEERWPRWYLGLTGGYAYMDDQDVSGNGNSSMALDSDGLSAGVAIGYLPNSSIPVINAMRFEGEVTYHTAGIANFAQVGGGQVKGNKAYRTIAYMFNGLYDLPLDSQWSPYIGAGVGIASVGLPINSGAGNTSDSDNVWAYQGLVGIGYTPKSIPNTQWSLGYRYLATAEANFGNVKADYSTNSIEAGAKFRF